MTSWGLGSEEESSPLGAGAHSGLVGAVQTRILRNRRACTDMVAEPKFHHLPPEIKYSDTEEWKAFFLALQKSLVLSDR